MKVMTLIILLTCAACDPGAQDARCRMAQADARARNLAAPSCEGPVLPRLPRG